MDFKENMVRGGKRVTNPSVGGQSILYGNYGEDKIDTMSQ